MPLRRGYEKQEATAPRTAKLSTNGPRRPARRVPPVYTVARNAGGEAAFKVPPIIQDAAQFLDFKTTP